MDEKWDYLIILDACRYDYFSRLYKKYLSGDLEKVYSLGSCTSEWCINSFKEYYFDIVYISTNPYINSITEVGGFSAKKHFYRVIDLWDYCWDEDLGTVPPEKVFFEVKRLKTKFPNKRLIIHYMQPHEPYLNLHLSRKEYFEHDQKKTWLSDVLRDILRNQDNTFKANIREQWYTNALSPILKNLSFVLKKIGLFGENPQWKFNEYLKLSPVSPMDAVRRKFGDDVLKQLYRSNLEIVLASVADLIKKILSGVIVVTSDHGELLGESGSYAHPCKSNNKILREIPWLKLNGEELRKESKSRPRRLV